MAAEDGEQTVEASAPAPAEDARGESPVEKESRKRRAPNADGSTAKRQRKTRDEPAGGPEAQDARPRTDAGPRSSAATQEEKRRGKRLFGGLLNTLSQEAGNSQQQRRRHEIEQRQLAKMQRQAADDDKRRAEKRATLHDVRVRQQITWEESVMRSKHAKRLRLAQFLRTSSSPEIYFLPWKLGRREKDTIDAQVRECKASITRELEDFKGRKEQHAKRHVPKGDSKATRAGSWADAPPPARDRETATADHVKKRTTATDDDAHDDAGDVMVEGEEDVVIY